MNKLFKLTTILAVTVLTVANAQLLDTTLATVRLSKTEVVSEREMLRQFKLLETQLNASLSGEQKEEVFQSKINSILINQAARRAGIRAEESEIQNAVAQQKASLNAPISDAEYQRLVVEQTGLSWNDYRAQIEERILQEKYITSARPNLLNTSATPSDREIKTTYEQNIQNFLNPSMSGSSHIFIDLRGKNDAEWTSARRTMAGYHSRIRNGGRTEFDKILRETLDDAGVTGGDFGYIISGDTNAVQALGSGFVQKLLDLDEGVISAVMESAIGLHIVRITDRRSPRLLELDDPLLPGQSLTVRRWLVEYIRNRKQQEALVEALREITGELREEAEIRVLTANIPW